MASPNSHRRSLARHAALFLALFLLMFCGGIFGLDMVSREAAVCDSVCRQLAANTTEGRQALVSSVWWPPLPFLLRLPFQLVLKSQKLPMASLAVGALFGAASIVLLLRIMSRWGIGRLRFAVAAGLALHPAFLRVCFDGSSGTTATYCALLAAYGLGGWVESRSLRPLVYFAFAIAMLLVVSPAMAAWGLALFLLFLGDLVGRQFKPRQREGAVILALTPLAYTFGLWILMNWLVMGDGLYFLRSLLTSGIAPSALPAPVGLTRAHKAAAVISGVLFVLSLLRRHRLGAYVGLAATLPLLIAHILNAHGLFWDSVPLLFCLFPLCILACCAFAGRTGTPRAVRVVVVCLPILLTPWSMKAAGGFVDREGLLDRSLKSDRSSAVEQRVLAVSKFSKVYVCGYDGFLFTGADPSPVFVNSLDFNFYKAMDDYRGHALYVLIHEPDGRSAMDSIHWKFKDMYRFGSRATLASYPDFGPWRLYEIFQPME